jgi:pSer/pThr/pTyr-binding forkhead associated (FHA) protein
MAGGGAAAPAAAPVAAPAPSGSTRGALVVIRPDGSEGDSYPLGDQPTNVGRDAGGLFASDSYLSPQHAVFKFKGNELVVEDTGSLNGIYVRIDAEAPVVLDDGSIFRIGQEILRFERIKPKPRNADGVELMGSADPGFIGRIRLVIGRETYGNSYCVPPDGMHLGRERGDIIFPDDGYVSGLHCRIHEEGGRVFLTDVGSSNGTFVRVTGSHQLKSGSLVLMGQQLFRVEY